MEIPVLLVLVIFSVISTSAQVQLEIAFPNLTFNSPVDFQNANDGSDRIFVVEREGIIKVFPNSPKVESTKEFLNIYDRVSSGGEMGLLGLAFHPDYENNGYFYVNYTVSNPRKTIISRFQISSENPDSADKESELILLSFDQPYSNHNGGQVAFGSDGYLYIAAGDGGSGGDPENHAQNKASLLGKILRIDVDNKQDDLNYAIPSNNPFSGSTDGKKEEIFAHGLRNPWRFSFDPQTNLLWCADVGQGEWEEINIIENGKNYGWRCYEGSHTFNLDSCNGSNYVPPIWEYNHSEGVSITGGYVYRGSNIPELYGKYIYGDYGLKKIWALEFTSANNGVNLPGNKYLFSCPGSITSFGVDENQELYITAFDSKIYKFTQSSVITPPSNLIVTLNILGIALLIWEDNSNNEEGFKVERRSTKGSFYLIDSVDESIITYTDINLLNPISYSYRVYAYHRNGTSPYSNQSSITITSVPVELVAFTVNVSNNGLLLEWSTASEINNKGFEVERFLNDNWKALTFINGKGTTTEKQSYRFLDEFNNHAYKGTARYRLKQIDLDGAFSYSNEIAVEVDFQRKNFFLEQNFPNPFNPSTIIKYNIPEESKVEIKIFNVLGKAVADFVNEIKPAGFYQKEWNASNLPSGVYYINLKAQSLVSNRSFSKVIKTIYLK